MCGNTLFSVVPVPKVWNCLFNCFARLLMILPSFTDGEILIKSEYSIWVLFRL
jgi:hypothetical protein